MTVQQPDQQLYLQQIGELSRAAWSLRDHLLAHCGITAEVVRLEEAAHLLDRSLTQLAGALRIRPSDAGLPAITPRSPL